MYGPGQTWRGTIIVRDVEGRPVNADETPTVMVTRNGVDTATEVTVTNLAIGRYSATFDIPGAWDLGDNVEVSATAIVSDETWICPMDVFRLEVDLEDVKAKTDRIGAISMEVTQTFASDGSMRIVKGDSFVGDQALEEMIDDWSGPNLNGLTGTFYAVNAAEYRRKSMEDLTVELEVAVSFTQVGDSVTILYGDITSEMTSAIVSEELIRQIVADVGGEQRTVALTPMQAVKGAAPLPEA